MTPEVIKAIGEYIVMPIIGVGAVVAWLYFLTKD